MKLRSLLKENMGSLTVDNSKFVHFDERFFVLNNVGHPIFFLLQYGHQRRASLLQAVADICCLYICCKVDLLVKVRSICKQAGEVIRTVSIQIE